MAGFYRVKPNLIDRLAVFPSSNCRRACPRHCANFFTSFPKPLLQNRGHMNDILLSQVLILDSRQFIALMPNTTSRITASSDEIKALLRSGKYR